MSALDALIGTWDVEVIAPWAQDDVRATTTFEWDLDGAYVLQRSSVDHPAAPDALCVLAEGEDGSLCQHYFDSRGVTRLYAMTLDDTTWTLRREAPDFSPLPFAQRFTGTFEDDGATIRSRWEIRHEGRDWELDFDLVYRRSG